MERSNSSFEIDMDKELSFIFDLSEEAISAIDKQSSMTWEIFSECMEYCSKNRNENLLYRLLGEYPEFAKKYAENLE